jgi:hypothetical protein
MDTHLKWSEQGLHLKQPQVLPHCVCSSLEPLVTTFSRCLGGCQHLWKTPMPENPELTESKHTSETVWMMKDLSFLNIRSYDPWTWSKIKNEGTEPQWSSVSMSFLLMLSISKCKMSIPQQNHHVSWCHFQSCMYEQGDDWGKSSWIG